MDSERFYDFLALDTLETVNGIQLFQQDATTTEPGTWPAVILSSEETQKRIEELEAKVAEVDIIRIVAEEETMKAREKLKRLEKAMSCVICLDVLQKAHALECGHSVCYECLKAWWTRHDDEAIIAAPVSSTDEGGTFINPPTRPQRPPTVRRQKVCPQCKSRITHRPPPNYLVRDLVDIMNDHHHRVHTQSSEDQASQASPPPPPQDDPWEGIFYPPHLHRTRTPRQGGHPNPTHEEDITAIVYRGAERMRREVSEALARRQQDLNQAREMDQARENSQRMVFFLERTLRERAIAAGSPLEEISGGSVWGMTFTTRPAVASPPGVSVGAPLSSPPRDVSVEITLPPPPPES